MNTSNSSPGPGLTRRQSIQFGAASVAAAVPLSQPSHAGDLPLGPTTAAWMVPLPVPKPKKAVAAFNPAPTKNPTRGECGRPPHQVWCDPAACKLYSVQVKEALHSFHPQLPSQTIWGYDGTYPGPCIVARYNEPVMVRFHNQIDPYAQGFGSPEISVHLHNMHAAAESDGFAGDYWGTARNGPGIAYAGRYKDHLYTNRYAGFSQDPAGIGDPREALGTLWFHDHRMDYTEQNVYRGMVGTYLLFDDIDSGDERDPNPQALRLPSGVGRYDIPLVIADFLFDASGYVSYNPLLDDKGHLGNKVTVNGKIQPFFRVERRKYRFRLLDASIARFYEFYLVKGTTAQNFTYIANDGNLLEAPLTMGSVRLAPAERADIVIDFSQYPIGTSLFLVNRLVMKDGRGPESVSARGEQLLRFDVAAEAAEPDVSQVPARLREQPPINLNEVVRTRRWEFDKDNAIWTVNKHIFNVEKAAAVVQRNATEIWELKGNGSWHHPVHIHMEEGRILSRNGLPPPPHERGRKDVFVLAPDETVRVFMKFRDFTGKYLLHCHNLTHEDHSMMARFDVAP